MTLNYPLHIPTLSYEEALEYVSLRYDNLSNINYNLICQYPDICEIATQQYPKALKFVPVNLQPKFSLNCIQRYPYGVCYIPKIQRTFNLCVTAIEQLNQALGRTETQHILHAIFHSTAVDLSTIDSNNPYHIAIYFIKTPKKQQNNLQLLKNFITTSTKHLVKIISPYISTNLIKQLPVEDMSKTRTLQNIANNILYTTYFRKRHSTTICR